MSLRMSWAGLSLAPKVLPNLNSCSQIKLPSAEEKISGLFKAKYFYSGLSPACDEETRLFTQCNVGPISLNYKK